MSGDDAAVARGVVSSGRVRCTATALINEQAGVSAAEMGHWGWPPEVLLQCKRPEHGPLGHHAAEVVVDRKDRPSTLVATWDSPPTVGGD